MKPILFSTPMVQALLNTAPGVWPAQPIDASKPCKSQTRRVIKDINQNWRFHCLETQNDWNRQSINGCHAVFDGGNMRFSRKALCQVGDILYVRETFTKDRDGNYLYRGSPMFNDCAPQDFSWNWSPAIHMPREASRLFLEVKSVRVERVQDITETDAKAEGSFFDRCECLPRKNDKTVLEMLFNQTQCVKVHGYEFKTLWDSINAKRGYSWESNPWVWVYEFARVER